VHPQAGESTAVVSMVRCPLCESEVPDGRASCDACGQPLGRPLAARGSPEALRRALDAARKDLASSAKDRADTSFGRHLIERAEQTESAGDLGRALELARAARRAIDLAKRRTRVAEALARADGVLQDATQAGIETITFQRTIERARALAAQGDPVRAEQLLRKLSVRALDQRRERLLQAVLDRAQARLDYARERGGSVADAEALLADARESLALREYSKIHGLCTKAVEKAEAARKYARALGTLDRVVTDVDHARKTGVNITDARKSLTSARDALRRGVYVEVQSQANRARAGLREARRYALAEQALRESEREAAREKRKGADLGRADALLEQAERALAAKEYAKVRVLAKEIHDASREASQLKHVQDSIAALQLDGQDLRGMGIDATEFEAVLAELLRAVDAKDLASARRLVAHARHAAETTRDAHYRAELDRSLRIVLANASRGLDPEVARQLLRQADDAVSVGKSVDLQSLIDARLATADTETAASLNERVMLARDEIVRLRQAGQDTVAMEGKLADSAIAIQEKRYPNADGLLDAVEHDFHTMRENLRGTAAELLGRARGEIDHAEAAGIPVDAAVVAMFREAEAAYSESRYGDTVYIGKSCIDEVQRITQSTLQEKQVVEAEEAKARAERIQEIQRRMSGVSREIEALTADSVDLSEAGEALDATAKALRDGDLEVAEKNVAAAEGIVKGVKSALRQQAEQAFALVKQKYEQAKAEGIGSPEMEAHLGLIDSALKEDRPTKALKLAAELDRTIEGGRRDKLYDAQRAALDKARSAASKFITVKKIIEDLRKADIDITGAEDGLKAAEQALENRAFDDVDKILADLDATAKDLMGELVAASRSLIGRAERRIQDGRERGITVDEAVELLTKAEGHFEHAEYADAVEYARAAEKKVQDAIRIVDEARAAERRRAQDTARADIAAVKKTIGDLARADIAIMNADGALSRAESAFEAGRYENVSLELAETKEMAMGLSFGLAAAARDLVTVAEKRVEEVRTAGVDPGRADMVLLNAREAIQDGRYVEAIEYKKVIEDILIDAQRAREARSIRDQLSEYRARIDAHVKLGADMRVPEGLLAKSEERLSRGEVDGLEDFAIEVDHAIGNAAKAHLDGLVGTLTPLIEEGAGLGLPREELDERRQHAAEAAVAGDLEAVYRIKGDLQESVLEAKRRSLLKRSVQEIQGLEDVLVQSDRLGIPIVQARSHLDQARRSIETGDVDGFQSGLAQAKAALDESRTSHFVDRYESRMHSVSAMIANAKRLGAEIGEAEGSLVQAEEALRKNDLSMVDILIKQAEVSVGIQISNFIKNRYPNLVMQLPATGLQANVWNRYVFEVENRGKLPARNVEFAFDGALETKGTQPIPELGVGERKLIEVGLKPTASGEVPFAIDVTYQRMFDENRYELKEKETLRVQPEGTYLVEDVFLIHSDGRLISHHSRKFREEIDEDIFSGMLTVVQDFIKDSFRSRSHLGIKRLDFGDSKILIERSPHTFVAAVILGHEPQLLPLYILQVLKEIEDRYGTVLEKWTGLLHQLEGVDDIIRKLLDVARDPNADMGAMSDSPITVTAKVIDALGAAQTEEANRLLAQAQSTLETDIQLAWQMIEQAKLQAENTQGQLQQRMGEMLAAARDTVQEMKIIGVDVSQAELLLKEAEEALTEGKYDRVREIHAGLHESLERQKGELAAKRVEIELASLINDIQIAKSQNLDAREAESYLTKIENAIQKKNYRQMEDFLRRAKESLARQRRHTVLTRAKEELGKLQATIAEAKDVHADLGDVELLLGKAESALKAEDLKDIEPLIERAQATLKARVEQILKDRYPRLFLETSHAGLQANRWNRFELQITNKGDWPAKAVIPIVNGPADVEGLRSVEKLAPNEKVSLEFGLRPKEAGTMDLDFEIHYTRPLDDAKHQVTDSTVVRVEPEGGYSVDDAILVHADGTLICHESRAYLLPEETSKAAKLEADVRTLMAKGFAESDAKGIQRAQMGDRSVIAFRGPSAYLAIGVRGREPTVLPLYAVDVLREVHEQYGPALDDWSGDPSRLPGVRELVRRLLFATDVPGVSLGPLEDTAVSKIPMLLERGLLGGKGGGFLESAYEAIEANGYEEGRRLLQQVKDAAAGPTEEISKQIQKAVLAVKESGTLQLTDEQVQAYVDVLRRVLEAIFQAKQRASIERYWPVSRVAIKAADGLGFDAISAFRKIIVSQSGAKELDIVTPGETWRGMRIDIDVHMDSVSAAYKLWAKKIEILLRSQDAWRIKAGLDKGEYSVGIEGQKVRIDPTMVSFVESVPEHVVEEPFEGGVVYLDTRMTKDLLAEGYAREIVDIVRESRRDMRLSEESVVEIDIVANSNLRGMLKPWRDLILREANALEVRFTQEAPEDGYVVETLLGQDRLYLGIKPAQM